MVPEPARVVSETPLHGTRQRAYTNFQEVNIINDQPGLAVHHALGGPVGEKVGGRAWAARRTGRASRSGSASWCARSARGRRLGFAATSSRRRSPGRRAGRSARGGTSGWTPARRWSCPGRAARPARPRADGTDLRGADRPEVGVPDRAGLAIAAPFHRRERSYLPGGQQRRPGAGRGLGHREPAGPDRRVPVPFLDGELHGAGYGSTSSASA